MTLSSKRRNCVHRRCMSLKGATLEVQTNTVRPHDVLTTSFLPDLEFTMDRVTNSPPGGAAPGSTEVLIEGPLEDGADGEHHIQTTVGLSLEHIPKLFKLARDERLLSIMPTLEAKLGPERVCKKPFDDRRCSVKYRALVAMAALVLKSFVNEECKTGSPPIYCQYPYLVRTHFGDTTRHVQKEFSHWDRQWLQ